MSHVHSNVETLREPRGRTLRGVWLQLSHVHSNVETVGVGIGIDADVAASIEPRSFKRGNPNDRMKVLRHVVLQLSHVHSNVETL